MSTQPAPEEKKSTTNGWTYLNPSSGASFATHHAEAAFERQLRKEEAFLLEQLAKNPTAPVVASKEVLEKNSLETKALQGEWIMISEFEEWDMMPEMGKLQENKEAKKKKYNVAEKESKIVDLVVGWVSGQK